MTYDDQSSANKEEFSALQKKVLLSLKGVPKTAPATKEDVGSLMETLGIMYISIENLRLYFDTAVEKLPAMYKQPTKMKLKQ